MPLAIPERASAQRLSTELGSLSGLSDAKGAQERIETVTSKSAGQSVVTRCLRFGWLEYTRANNNELIWANPEGLINVVSSQIMS